MIRCGDNGMPIGPEISNLCLSHYSQRGKPMKSALIASLFAAALSVSTGASADLLNISTTSLQSAVQQAGACGIASSDGSTWRGLKIFVVFSEATRSGSDPTLVATLLNNGEWMSNDDWTDSYTINGVAKTPLSSTAFSSLLRRPNGLLDAGVLISTPPGWSLCVASKEVGSSSTLYPANISITDVTNKYVSIVGNGYSGAGEQAQSFSSTTQVLGAAMAALAGR